MKTLVKNQVNIQDLVVDTKLLKNQRQALLQLITSAYHPMPPMSPRHLEALEGIAMLLDAIADKANLVRNLGGLNHENISE